MSSRLNEDERFVGLWTDAMQTCAMVLETHWPSLKDVWMVVEEAKEGV